MHEWQIFQKLCECALNHEIFCAIVVQLQTVAKQCGHKVAVTHKK